MRPSLSLAGTMVLSVVVDGVVKHMALDGNQLDTRSLEARPVAWRHHAARERTSCISALCFLLPLVWTVSLRSRTSKWL